MYFNVFYVTMCDPVQFVSSSLTEVHVHSTDEVTYHHSCKSLCCSQDAKYFSMDTLRLISIGTVTLYSNGIAEHEHNQ